MQAKVISWFPSLPNHAVTQAQLGVAWKAVFFNMKERQLNFQSVCLVWLQTIKDVDETTEDVKKTMRETKITGGNRKDLCLKKQHHTSSAI